MSRNAALTAVACLLPILVATGCGEDDFVYRHYFEGRVTSKASGEGIAGARICLRTASLPEAHCDTSWAGSEDNGIEIEDGYYETGLEWTGQASIDCEVTVEAVGFMSLRQVLRIQGWLPETDPPESTPIQFQLEPEDSQVPAGS
jgi:hypothetical protein